MKELLVRTLSGAVLVALIIAGVFVSVWTCWALTLVIVAIGTYEMSRLMHVGGFWQLLLGELAVVGAFVLGTLVVMDVLPVSPFLLVLLPLLPFLQALFSTTTDFKTAAAFVLGSMALLSLPCVLMVFMRERFSPQLLLFVFILLWANDTFAYLTGRLFGKHKLFERISPGKTIEGSIGGLVLTLAGIVVFYYTAGWLSAEAGLSLAAALGMGLIAVVFGTLGDLCESMLKRQAGVKDSGRLIPGHGGVLDRFDSVLFSVPFVFVYLLLL